MRPPTDISSPIVMCAVGTGISVMLAILQEINELCKKPKQADNLGIFQKSGTLHGGILLIQVYHHKDACPFQAELSELSLLLGFSYVTACSEKSETAEKKIEENGELINRLLKDPNSHYYYSALIADKASSSLGQILEMNEKAIMATLTPKDSKESPQVIRQQSESLIAAMKEQGRWHIETQ